MGTPVPKKCLLTLLTLLFLLSIIVLLSITSTLTSPLSSYSHVPSPSPSPSLPSFGYYIYGGTGEKEQILRLLLAVYHPRNRYLLHLTADAGNEDRNWLLEAVRGFENVDVVGKPMWLTGMGATYVAAALRAAAILLKLDGNWSWFISLNAFDYPLLTQDDLAYAFSTVKRDTNFIEVTSDLSWKEDARIRPIVVDPAIYLSRRSSLFTATEKRPTPDAFKVFTGSPWTILTRSFLEFCVIGWDNLPRTLLMYFNNVMLPQEGYFHSVICNSPEFSNTTINNNLRYMVWDRPPKMDVHFLEVSDFDEIVQSGAAFARRFQKDDPVLTMIDKKILHRRPNQVGPGEWCEDPKFTISNACVHWRDASSIKPALKTSNFSESLSKYLDDRSLQSTCK